jgi:hypothetical protein
LAVVRSKADDKAAVEGLRQAKDYADKFAFATNRLEIIEFDCSTGLEARLTEFLRPDDLIRNSMATSFPTRCDSL